MSKTSPVLSATSAAPLRVAGAALVGQRRWLAGPILSPTASAHATGADGSGGRVGPWSGPPLAHWARTHPGPRRTRRAVVQTADPAGGGRDGRADQGGRRGCPHSPAQLR